jgi:hypothetical protein
VQSVAADKFGIGYSGIGYKANICAAEGFADMNNESQEEVLAFLADPATHGDQKVRRIDTHAASVFLADDRALKIKRAVRFPFLDYSTLAKRQACEAELAVNAPYTPEIYRGVKAITREADGRLAIGGSGPAVEWAVEMRRFDEKCTLDHLAGEIDDALAEALGRAVAAAHAKAPAVEAAAWIAALGSYIDEHVEAFGAHMDIFPAAEIDSLAHASRAAYDRIVPLLTERGRRGLVRRIHGDPSDGPPRARPRAAGKHRVQPISRRDAAHRRPGRPCGAAIFSLDACGDPRQSDGSAHGTRAAGGAAFNRGRGARLFRLKIPIDRQGSTTFIAMITGAKSLWSPKSSVAMGT